MMLKICRPVICFDWLASFSRWMLCRHFPNNVGPFYLLMLPLPRIYIYSMGYLCDISVGPALYIIVDSNNVRIFLFLPNKHNLACVAMLSRGGEREGLGESSPIPSPSPLPPLPEPAIYSLG